MSSHDDVANLRLLLVTDVAQGHITGD
jgi:hypothetical protein